jgi:putative transposase
MRKKRFTEHQIIKVLKQVEGGRSAADVCREYGISQATYYNWKAKYGGMEASDIKRLKLGFSARNPDFAAKPVLADYCAGMIFSRVPTRLHHLF